MTLNEYQEAALKSAIYPKIVPDIPIYPALKLAGESGEVAEKVGKAIRDGIPLNFQFELAKELGDVLWYISALANDIGFSLESIAKFNLEKLESRVARGKLQGSGDNR